MYPLLQYATNLSNPEAEVLVEEALKCWGVALAGESSQRYVIRWMTNPADHVIQ